MEISIEKESKRFNDYLQLPDNNQMMFSGVFGIGKTYFLKKFFESNSDKSDVFLLSPVNYSISNNEDIINYIKYDIAFELLGKTTDFEKTDFSKSLTAQYYLKDNYKDIIQLFAKNLGPIGQKISDIYDSLKAITNNIKKHNKDVQVDEKEELISFLTELAYRDKSIYEEDRITQLISGLIEKLKNDDNDREMVLVIDDLDRLDPEHIFRILNVFACHLGIDSPQQNKFGFDKVILVCDIDNIRHIFHSKYGANVDFSGYIDKFYSREIFYFNNRETINESINKILSSIETPEDFRHVFDLEQSNHLERSNHNISLIIREILEDLLSSNLLNLRTLLRFSDKEYLLKFYAFKIDDSNWNIQNWHFQQVLAFDFLVSAYGSKTNLQTAFEKLTTRSKNKPLYKTNYRKYDSLVTFIDFKNHKGQEGSYNYINKDLNINIKYTIRKFGHSRDEVTATMDTLTYVDNSEKERRDFPFAHLLKIAFDEYLALDIKTT